MTTKTLYLLEAIVYSRLGFLQAQAQHDNLLHINSQTPLGSAIRPRIRQTFPSCLQHSAQFRHAILCEVLSGFSARQASNPRPSWTT